MAINLSRINAKPSVTFKPKKLVIDLKYKDPIDQNPHVFYKGSNYVYWLAFNDSDMVKIGSTEDYTSRFKTLNDIHQNRLGLIDFSNTVLFKCQPHIHPKFVETQIHLAMLDNDLSTPISGDGGSEFFTFENEDDAREMFKYISNQTEWFTGYRFLDDLYPNGVL